MRQVVKKFILLFICQTSHSTNNGISSMKKLINNMGSNVARSPSNKNFTFLGIHLNIIKIFYYNFMISFNFQILKCNNYLIFVVDMGKKVKKQTSVKLQNIEQQINKTHLQQKSMKSITLQTKKPKLQQSHQFDNKKQETSQKQGIPAKTKKIKHARLIIRNLVYDINEKHIKKLISPFGQVKQINIPKHPDQNRSKGFAFVQMSTKNQCLKAIKKLNGTQYKGRPIVLDMAVSKDNYMTEKLKSKEVQKKQVKQESNIQQDQQSIKKQHQEEQGNQQEQQQIQDQDQINEQNSQKEQEDIEQKEQRQRQDHLFQIFIRNLPISTTEDDLYKHFIKFGKIAFVRICKNKQTNVSKGTAFIKFHDQSVAHKLIQYSRSYEMFLLKKLRNFVPDPTIKLQIDGTIMKIFPVQSRKQITSKLKERQGQGKTDKRVKPVKRIKKLQDLVKTDINDKRKLSLSLLGRWKAQQNMNDFDYQTLKAHEKQKIQKLKNPNSLVSDTRIILKHLQKTITQQQIRTICLKFLEDRNLSKSNLTYCKLMLERDMKKSAGFAFIQFRKHQISKDFINLLVEQPKILQNRLYIVEFAIQDSRKILKLSRKNKAAGVIKDKSKEKKDYKGGASNKFQKQRQKKVFKRKMIKK